MKPILDLSKEYGLVLEGGGAKGAYQIGVWKALKEAGVKIKGVAGSSVGALNGALICMDDLKKAEALWRDISYSRVMEVDDELTIRDFFRMLGEGGADITPLRNMIEENVEEEQIRQSPLDFYACTFSVTDRKELSMNMKEVPEGQLTDMLLASAYFPAFKNEKLHGKTYVDGAVLNLVPIDLLLEQGYENLIVVRLFGMGHQKKVEIPEGVQVIEIAPRVSLGNIMEFDGARSRHNLQIGYYDALRSIYGLAGEIYYIEETGEACYDEKLEETARRYRIPRYQIYTWEQLAEAVYEAEKNERP